MFVDAWLASFWASTTSNRPGCLKLRASVQPPLSKRREQPMVDLLNRACLPCLRPQRSWQNLRREQLLWLPVSLKLPCLRPLLTTGILDLGASQSVMGQHQVPEFLANLPKPVRELVQERPVSMSFRFGNNSIVPCHRALLVPVDRFWDQDCNCWDPNTLFDFKQCVS